LLLTAYRRTLTYACIPPKAPAQTAPLKNNGVRNWRSLRPRHPRRCYLYSHREIVHYSWKEPERAGLRHTQDESSYQKASEIMDDTKQGSDNAHAIVRIDSYIRGVGRLRTILQGVRPRRTYHCFYQGRTTGRGRLLPGAKSKSSLWSVRSLMPVEMVPSESELPGSAPLVHRRGTRTRGHGLVGPLSVKRQKLPPRSWRRVYQCHVLLSYRPGRLRW
jgi:hypothetical protein